MPNCLAKTYISWTEIAEIGRQEQSGHKMTFSRLGDDRLFKDLVRYIARKSAELFVVDATSH